jgi:transcriptional activator of eps genes
MQGNPESPVWLCEATSRLAGSPIAASPEPLQMPVVWNADFRQRNQDEMPKWQSHQKIARILTAVHTLATDPGAPDWKEYFQERLYGPAGNEFWLSLYPALVRTVDSASGRSPHDTLAVPRTLRAMRRYAGRADASSSSRGSRGTWRRRSSFALAISIPMTIEVRLVSLALWERT